MRHVELVSPTSILTVVLLLCVLVQSHFSHGYQFSSRVFERIVRPPTGWRRWRSPLMSEVMHIRIGVKHASRESFHQRIRDISTPGHANYGSFLSKDELSTILQPSKAARTEISQWLWANGITDEDVESRAQWIEFDASVERVEKLLDTSYYWYSNANNKIAALRTLHYSIPSHLHRFIDVIHPSTAFDSILNKNHSFNARPHVKRHQLGHSAKSGNSILNTTSAPENTTVNGQVGPCSQYMVPDCLRLIYNITHVNFSVSPAVGNSIASTGFLGGYSSAADLFEFQKYFDLQNEGSTFTFVGISGDTNKENTTDAAILAEGNLDTQWTIALSAPINSTYLSTPGRGPLRPDLDAPTVQQSNTEPFLDLLYYLGNVSDIDLPRVISIPYGENEQEIPLSYAQAVCNGFAELASRGVSVIVGAGDTGPGTACQSNAGQNKTQFTPYFPASCPWVTSVGSTSGISPEVASNFSGGGFSNVWAVPWYQTSDINQYLAYLGKSQSGLFNASGRGIPDVAANGYEFQIIVNSKPMVITGTSASVPVFAGIIARLNNARLQAGQPALGFLNPWLYSAGRDGFSDITQSGSSGCNSASKISGLAAPPVPYAGWNATVGWDPVTGLGTPNFGLLLHLIGLNQQQLNSMSPSSTRTEGAYSRSSVSFTSSSSPSSSSSSSQLQSAGHD